jgi:hypothetical protein
MAGPVALAGSEGTKEALVDLGDTMEVITEVQEVRAGQAGPAITAALGERSKILVGTGGGSFFA